ncbi:hypothetical protein [Amycolatopsis australiensis]|uniref:hypothetical protein n=1 Tax=Amycolatopsis australiensis TaxID=546364 RepID=UPI0011613EF0|nr:hypothetical protein [Amycolatopsis australiensis]
MIGLARRNATALKAIAPGADRMLGLHARLCGGSDDPEASLRARSPGSPSSSTASKARRARRRRWRWTSGSASFLLVGTRARRLVGCSP